MNSLVLISFFAMALWLSFVSLSRFQWIQVPFVWLFSFFLSLSLDIQRGQRLALENSQSLQNSLPLSLYSTFLPLFSLGLISLPSFFSFSLLLLLFFFLFFSSRQCATIVRFRLISCRYFFSPHPSSVEQNGAQGESRENGAIWWLHLTPGFVSLLFS